MDADGLAAGCGRSGARLRVGLGLVRVESGRAGGRGPDAQRAGVVEVAGLGEGLAGLGLAAVSVAGRSRPVGTAADAGSKPPETVGASDGNQPTALTTRASSRRERASSRPATLPAPVSVPVFTSAPPVIWPPGPVATPPVCRETFAALRGQSPYLSAYLAVQSVKTLPP